VLISYIDRSQRTNQYTKLPPTDDDSICGHRSTSGIVIYFSVARLRQVVSGIMTTMDTATSSSGTQILSTRLQGRQTNTVISSVPTMVGGGVPVHVKVSHQILIRLQNILMAHSSFIMM